MTELYKRYFIEKFDEKGLLKAVETGYDSNFNFAYDVMDEYAKESPDMVALVHKDIKGNVRKFTYSDLKNMSDRTANMLRNLGVKRHDSVMLILKRRYEFWICMLAIHKLGAVAIPTSHMVSDEDIRERLVTAKCRTVICVDSADVCDNVISAASELADVNVVCVGNDVPDSFLGFKELFDKADASFERVETDATDAMLYYFTSGTSGQPKAVIHNFSYPIAHIFTAKYWHAVVPGGLHLTVADSGWAKSAWGKMYGQWFMKCAVLVYDYDVFYAEDMLKVLEEEKVTTFCAPPTIYKYLVRKKIEDYNLESLVSVTTAGEALPKEVDEKFYAKTGLKIRQGYGQTETTLLTCTMKGCEQSEGSIGTKSPLYDIAIVDEDNNPVDAGNEGEIVIVPKDNTLPIGLFCGYLGEENMYKEVWEGGVYHTKDKAYVDAFGNYFFIGRNDDVIKSSGYRIGPTEVEDIINEHPAVSECAVTGFPSKNRGQVVKATIILKDGFNPDDNLKNEIKEFVKMRTAMYKYPRMIEFVKDLPRTTNGKISRSMIRKKDGC